MVYSLQSPPIHSTRQRDLWLTKKLAIMKVDPESLINTRDEFVPKCRRMNKFTLRFFKRKQLIKYISSFILRKLWDIVYVTAFKEYYNNIFIL